MIVVADTSPLNYLILIDQIEVLPRLFRNVKAPHAVFREMTRRDAPARVREWALLPPDWITAASASQIDATMPVDFGERAAICLALENQASLLLVDDLKARHVALARGLNVMGTLGVLEAAAQRQWLNLVDAIDAIRRNGFFISDELVAAAVARDVARRRA